MSFLQSKPRKPLGLPPQFASNRVRLTYVSALLLVVILCAINYAVLNHATAAQLTGIQLIDTSNHQRILSQRIALLASLLVNNPSEELRTELIDVITEMRTTHALLQNAALPELHAIYNDAANPLASLLHSYLVTAEQVAVNQSETNVWHMLATMPALVNTLDELTTRFTEVVQADTRRLQSIALLMFVVLTLVVFLVGVGIFLPMERRIRADQSRLVNEIEERKYVENTLQSSQEFVYQILNMTPDLVYVFDLLEQRGIFSNRELASILGYSSTDLGEFNLQTLEKIMHPEDFQRIQNSAFPLEHEYRLQAADGTWRWFYSRDLVFTRQPDGQPAQIIGTSRDITERKQAENILQASEERFRTLVTHLPVGIFQTDASGNCVFINPRWSEMTGLTFEQAQGQGWANALHPEDREMVMAVWYTTALAGREFNLEYRYQQPGGEVVWVAGSATALRNAAGEVTGYFGTITDVTERKQAEHDVQESEEKFRQLAENLEQVFWLADIQTHTPIYLNPAYEKTWGIPREQVLKNPDLLLELVHPDDRARMVQAQRELIQNGGFDVEFRITRPDGELRWLWSRGFPVLNDQHIPYRFVGVTEDVTERKQAEQQRMELGIEREKIHMLSQFIADTSHDLRTPLTVISTSVYLLGKGINDERQQERLSMIAKQVTHIDHLIGELQDMVKIDQLTSYEATSLPVNPLIESLIEAISHAAAAKNIALQANLPSEFASIHADPHYFQQALRHILDNALHYTPTGGTITLNTQVEEHHVVVEIQDTGIGITHDDLPHIFDRYYKANKARTKNESGAGIGLTMAKKIIEGHGGSITVTSVIDSGSVFRVVMPLALKYQSVH